MSKKRVTISDVAKAADVSIATVSRVLNRTDYPVQDELKKRVLNAAQPLHYMPNFFGKSLKSGKSNDIGVIVPSLINPFYSEVIAGMEKECRTAGYNPIFCSSSHKPEKEKELIHLLQEKCVEGMLISTINQDADYLQYVMAHNSNIVFFDQPIPNFNGNSVTFDFYQAGVLSTRFLLGKGHRNIAFLSAPFDRYSRRAIFKGFSDEFHSAGLVFPEQNLLIFQEDPDKTGSSEFENGRKLAQLFLESHCSATAIVTINDITAFCIIRELIQNGCRVPEDISVMSFDNINFSAMLNPPLTTIRQPSFEMGRLAAEVLINWIRSQNKIPTQILLKPTVVERESVRALN